MISSIIPDQKLCRRAIKESLQLAVKEYAAGRRHKKMGDVDAGLSESFRILSTFNGREIALIFRKVGQSQKQKK
jgi:hypothetical protein